MSGVTYSKVVVGKSRNVVLRKPGTNCYMHCYTRVRLASFVEGVSPAVLMEYKVIVW